MRSMTTYEGMNVTIMGLGLHGGGLESARYFATHGARVIVTDLRDERVLAPSLEQLRDVDAGIRYVLGRHEPEDFERADMVIKNPGVRPDSPLLKLCRRVETDMSLFLAKNPATLSAVTGSKGKSSTVSAIHWGLCRARERGLLPGAAYMGGNITVSPLSFLDALTPEDDAALEFSSWQLGDLCFHTPEGDEPPLLKPRCAVLTAIMPDHLDRYNGMESYIADKRLIYREQNADDATIAGDDAWGRRFLMESRGRPVRYAEESLPQGVAGGWLADAAGPALARLPGSGEIVELVPARLLVPGAHQKRNLLAAGLALLERGLPPDLIRESMGSFPGIEHRLEFFHEAGGVRFYNDSAATIPEAAAAAMQAFDRPPLLVAGGADKNMDFSPMARAAVHAKFITLLAGPGTEKLRSLLNAAGIHYRGPFHSLDMAIRAVMDIAVPGDIVVLSPGCASFGMFLNEFDRGRRWKEAIRRLVV